jgi:hypothetical protein
VGNDPNLVLTCGGVGAADGVLDWTIWNSQMGPFRASLQPFLALVYAMDVGHRRRTDQVLSLAFLDRCVRAWNAITAACI